MTRLTGKVALVTGAARGMGLAHATALCEEGASVMLTDVLDGEGADAAAALGARGREARYGHLDVREARDWQRAVRETLDEFGRIDVLVNNAGVISEGDAVDEPEERWQLVIAVNQTGVFLGMKHVVPTMRETGGGSIVNISSVLGATGAKDYIAYQASKAAVLAMTKSAAITYATEGIRVNAICPGTVMTPMHEALPQDAVDEDLAATPMGRVGMPVEISAGVVFLASDQASFVTGSALHIDGGYLA
jgi:NAD(P)-dependent dehydrogenase (short-subunit alcohol dehydrogenase family)